MKNFSKFPNVTWKPSVSTLSVFSRQLSGTRCCLISEMHHLSLLSRSRLISSARRFHNCVCGRGWGDSIFRLCDVSVWLWVYWLSDCLWYIYIYIYMCIHCGGFLMLCVWFEVVMSVILCLMYSTLSLNFVLGKLRIRKAIYYYYYYYYLWSTGCICIFIKYNCISVVLKDECTNYTSICSEKFHCHYFVKKICCGVGIVPMKPLDVNKIGSVTSKSNSSTPTNYRFLSYTVSVFLTSVRIFWSCILMAETVILIVLCQIS